MNYILRHIYANIDIITSLNSKLQSGSSSEGLLKMGHTAPRLLEGTLRRTYRGFHSFRSSIGRNQLPGFRDCLTALFLIPDF